ncbi:MAG TPA: aminotransferase class I/II-fold pyridoxal phosphate-dependent enzyme [Solirubrobacterales bacterium]|nr:aminotransferase class I/II-fold pyridoxal phosphate-dependent enzyme [Solirubrobacterales bacterium]
MSETPYLDALLAYADRDPGRFHVPGHKGGPGADPGLRDAVGEAVLRLDVPAGIEGIDVGPDPAKAHTPFQRAQRLAAEAWGARRSWFLVNGGSGGNHAICLALAHAADRVVVQRNVHSSTIDGLVLSGLRPRFVAPELDPELGIAHCLTPEALDEGLASEPEAVAAMVVSPTYFGAVADVSALADVAHARGVPLVVDEAWGAHLRFSGELPDSALDAGADVVLSSVHKIVGSISQSAILHVGDSDLVDEAVFDRAVTLVESTSPNALLTASLDAARRQAVVRGDELLGETVSSLQALREEIRAIPGLEVLDERIAGRPGVYAYDPLRLVVDVRGTGATGHRIARLMREHDDIHLELFSENVVVAVFGIGEHAERTGERLVAALRHAIDELDAEPDEGRGLFAEPPPWGPTELSPREAFLAPQDVVAFDAAEGRIGAESLAAYPPGVPNVLPGERLTRPTLDYIADSVAHGGLVRGASDRSLRTVRVVVE